MSRTSIEPVDEASLWAPGLPPLSTLVAAMADLEDDPEAGPLSETWLDEIRLALAIELAVDEEAGGRPRLGGSTPTQWTETTVMPVFHRLSIRIARAPDA